MSLYLDSGFVAEAQIAKNFGWVKGITTDTATIAPSPMLLKRKISDMSDSEFYHSFIFLAGQGKDCEEFSPPPDRFKAGYNFLSQLLVFLKNQNSAP